MDKGYVPHAIGCALGLSLFATLGACARKASRSVEPPTASVVTAPEAGAPAMSAASMTACGDVVGSWSSTVDGLRGRIVTSGSKPDRSALDVVLEIENVSREAIELHWDGLLPLGFATFRLDDATGVDVKPAWAWPGNSPSGPFRAVFRPGKVVTYVVQRGSFPMMMGKRALRIGAFWGRELPTDGSKRSLRATLHAGPTHPGAPAYEGDELLEAPPTARVWSGTLEVPGVCIE